MDKGCKAATSLSNKENSSESIDKDYQCKADRIRSTCANLFILDACQRDKCNW